MSWLYAVVCELYLHMKLYSIVAIQWNLGIRDTQWTVKTVLNSEVVLFLRFLSMSWIGLGTVVAVRNSQVVPISQVVLKTGFTVHVIVRESFEMTVLKWWTTMNISAKWYFKFFYRKQKRRKATTQPRAKSISTTQRILATTFHSWDRDQTACRCPPWQRSWRRWKAVIGYRKYPSQWDGASALRHTENGELGDREKPILWKSPSKWFQPRCNFSKAEPWKPVTT